MKTIIIFFLALFAFAFSQVTETRRGSGLGSDPLVFTTVNVTDERVTYSQLRLVATGDNRGNVDAVSFSVGFDDSDQDGDRAAFLTVAYAIEFDYDFGMDMNDMTGADVNNMRDQFSFTFYGIAYDNLIEYVYDANGFTCSTIDGSASDCEDIARLVRVFPLENFTTPIDYRTEAGPLAGQLINVVRMTTIDDVFSAECRFSDRDFTYQGRTVGPFEMKCDITVTNYPYQATGNSIAINTFVLAGEFFTDFESDPEAGEFEFGRGIGAGFYVFNNTITPSNDTSVNLASVVSQDVVLANAVFDFQPEATVRTTIFSFLTPDANNFLWDPTVGVNAADISSAPVVSASILFSIAALLVSFF